MTGRTQQARSRGIKWVWKLDAPGPDVPRSCSRCGHVQLFDPAAPGIDPPPG
jgi:hypothetical protein